MSALFTGKNIIHFDRVSSTNNTLSEMLSNSKPLEEGSVILADEQSHGRGQHGTFWESAPAQNITLSLLFYPEFITIEKQFYLSMAVSLGICDFLQNELENDIQIKWPNDIYVGKQKIAGILIENSLINNRLKSSIIGIGLNVNQRFFNSDAPNPISMSLLSNRTYDIELLLSKLFHQIEIYYLHLKVGRYDYIKEKYLSKLFRYHENSMYSIDNNIVSAKIVDVETSGRLVLLINNERKSYDTKEIGFIL